jgi:hypothetical protein
LDEVKARIRATLAEKELKVYLKNPPNARHISALTLLQKSPIPANTGSDWISAVTGDIA